MLVTALSSARAGNGALVVIEGPAGIGKTRLLQVCRNHSREQGLTVLDSRGGELEREFSFGVVRQLFEEPLRRLDPGRRAALLDGAAGIAGSLLGLVTPPVAGAADPSFEALHGLYWLTANMAEDAPLCLFVDDCHWADEASLHFVSYLAGRLEGLAVLVVLTIRPDDARGNVLDRLSGLPEAKSLTPRPLTRDGTAELVRRSIEASDAFCDASHHATGGNPFLLRELLLAIEAEGIPASDETAIWVAEQGPATVARSVLLRLARLTPDAVEFARALAVLSEATLAQLAALAAIDLTRAAHSADVLANAEIVSPDEPLTFVHPIVRAAIYNDLGHASRTEVHRRAASTLAANGAPPQRIAAQLLATTPQGDDWAADQLARAADEALADGAPNEAAAYLRRALAEPAPPHARGKLMYNLGLSEALIRDPATLEHLGDALVQTVEPLDRVAVALAYSTALVIADRSKEAVDVLIDASDQLPVDSDLSLRIEAQILGASAQQLTTRAIHAERMKRISEKQLGDTGAERVVLVNLVAWAQIAADWPLLERIDGITDSRRARLRRLLERGYADGRLLAEETSDSQVFQLLAGAMTVNDWPDHNSAWDDAALEDARRRGSILGFALTSCFRAHNFFRRGLISDCDADARAALAAGAGQSWALAPAVCSILIEALIELDELREAQTVLHSAPDPARDSMTSRFLLLSRGRLHLALGQPAEALRDFLDCGAWLDAWGAIDPGYFPWRSGASAALLQLGSIEEAGELARREVEIAEDFGQPRALGIALRALAATTEDSATEILEHAVAVFEDSSARVEHARTLIHLGATLRRHNKRHDARTPLREGLELAHRHQARALEQQARTELLAAGARPRRVALSGIDSLTSTERRVGEMAARGLSNREIAQALFVTSKTVETHLRHAYRKLGITARTELAQLLQSSPTD